MIAPVTNPVGPHAPKHDRIRFLFMPIGYVRPMIAIALGTTAAMPMPCIALHALNITDPGRR